MFHPNQLLRVWSKTFLGVSKNENDFSRKTTFHMFNVNDVSSLFAHRSIKTAAKKCQRPIWNLLNEIYIWKNVLLEARNHQHGARGHQVAHTDHVGRPRDCSEISINMISVFTLMNIFHIYYDNITEEKLSKILFQKCASSW